MLTRLPLTSEVAVAHQLPRLGVVEGEAQTVDHVVEAALEETQQVLAGDALLRGALCSSRGTASRRCRRCASPSASRAAARRSPTACGGGSGRAGRAAYARRSIAALVGVAAIALEEQLHVFTPAEPTDRTGVACHVTLLLAR